MNLKLTRPLVFFDLETTGINIGKDRIVEISILKVFPNGTQESKTWLVNPVIEIPKEASDIHGITNEKVVNEPTFNELAPEVSKRIQGCDLAGFHKKEQRTLSAGYKFYCDKELTDAHSAEADTKATYEILLAQVDRYEDLGDSVKDLAAFSTHGKRADFAGFIAFNEEEQEIFTFGKYKGRTVIEVLDENPGYYAWIQNADFPLYTKKVLTAIKLRGLNTKLV